MDARSSLYLQMGSQALGSNNAGLWDSHIIGSIECGEFKQALTLYDTMRKKSLCPHPCTLVALLKACAKLKDVEHGCAIHSEVADRGLSTRDVFVGTGLVDMYVKCASLEKAQEVFKTLSCGRSVVTWNALISGYAKHGQSVAALKCLEQMKVEGVLPNAITFTCSLKACGSMSAAKKGNEICATISVMGLLKKDVLLGSSMVDMYSKCGLLKKAHEFLDALHVRAVGSWNALIGGYTKQECGLEAFQCFQQMQLEGISPNTITFICMLKTCGSMEAIDQGIELHAEIERRCLVERDPVVGSALVDMYFRCCLLTKGEEVFDRLSNRTIDSWNTLLTGYVEHELYECALNCLERMCQEGVFPDSFTFPCSLKACGATGNINKGMELHVEIARMDSFGKTLSIGNALVDMYFKCGIFTRALEVFDSLTHKDSVSWNVLLTGYVKFEHYKEALDCFTQLQRQAITPDAVTLACCLVACGASRAAGKGVEIHNEIERNGLLERDPVVGNALVDMYAKCGLVAKAQEVFDKLPRKDVDSWNALILGYLNHDCGEEVLDCLEQMQLQHVLPNAFTYASGLKACGSIGDIDMGRVIHVELERQNLLEREPIVGIALVGMYTDFGLLMIAQAAFDKISNRDTVLWNTLISGYAKNDYGAEVLNYAEQMKYEGFFPNAITYTSILKACGSLRDMQKGNRIHVQLERQGLLEGELFVGNALVDMYCKCGSIAKAHEVFISLPLRDIVSWNILITGYTNYTLSEEALTCLDSMQREGISPDAVTFTCSLKACGSIKAADKGREIHEEIERQGLLEMDLVIAIAMIDFYAKCGSLSKAQEIFDRLPERDSTAWNALIAGYAKHELNEEVLHCLDKMHLEDVCCDAITFSCSLKVCGSLGAAERGREIHAESKKAGLSEKDLLVGNGLVDMYCKGGFIVTAQEVFDKLSSPDIVSWNALIAGYAQLGESDSVFYMFDKMREDETSPDWITFVSALNACNHGGLVEKAAQCLNVMLANYEIVPTIEHFTCIVDMLGRAGQLNKAAKAMEEFPVHPNVVMWCTVLGACTKWNNLKLAKHAFDHAIHLDGMEMAAYVTMCNIYTDADNQDSKRFGLDNRFEQVVNYIDNQTFLWNNRKFNLLRGEQQLLYGASGAM